MVQCKKCGALCGTKHRISCLSDEYLCDKCAREEAKAQVGFIKLALLLAYSAIVTAIFTLVVIYPIGSNFGWETARVLVFVMGGGALALYWMLNKAKKGKKQGCFTRILYSVILALGCGLILEGAFCWESVTENLGDDVKASNVSKPDLHTSAIDSEGK